MNPKLERIIITVALVFVLIASFFIYFTVTFKSSKLTEAKKLISEFKIAKALEILNSVKSKGSKDEELDTLMLYALVKAKRFEEAKKQVENITNIPKQAKNYVLEMITQLSVHNEIQLIVAIVQKAPELDFNEEFFVKLSQERSSLDSEMEVLEMGYKYLDGIRTKLRDKKSRKAESIESSKIEAFILERCIENSEIFLGSGDYKSALMYLDKAKNLEILKTSSLKDEYYFNLAQVNKKLGNSQEAWKNMQISAQLGNERAKSAIQTVEEKIAPIETSL